MRQYVDDLTPRQPRTRRRHHHPDHQHSDHHRARSRDMHRGRGRGGRVPRGDVRTAVLLLLSDEPMHGYQLMQAVAERTGGRWQPSPGIIYPTISQLEDEGLITLTASAGRKLATLTEAGRGYVEANAGSWPDPFTPFVDRAGSVDLRAAVAQVHDAVRQVGRTGTTAQIEAAGRLLAETRKALYLLLAEGPETTGDDR